MDVEVAAALAGEDERRVVFRSPPARRDTLTLLLESPAGRHEHVSAANYQTEITVWVDDS
jgi:hypothetical protein